MPNTDIWPTTSSLHENICLLIHYLLQCAKFPNLKVITAVHDGGTGEEWYFPDESLLLPTKHRNSVTLKIIVSSGTLATMGHNKKCDPDWTLNCRYNYCSKPANGNKRSCLCTSLYLFATGIGLGLFVLQLFVHGLKTWSLDNISIKLVA